MRNLSGFAVALAFVAIFVACVAMTGGFEMRKRVEALESEHALHHPECPDIVEEHPLQPATRR